MVILRFDFTLRAWTHRKVYDDDDDADKLPLDLHSDYSGGAAVIDGFCSHFDCLQRKIAVRLRATNRLLQLFGCLQSIYNNFPAFTSFASLRGSVFDPLRMLFFIPKNVVVLLGVQGRRSFIERSMISLNRQTQKIKT